MRKMLFVAFAILLAVSLAGCTIFRMPGATVKGSVEFDDGTPAAYAKVTFIPASDYGSHIEGFADEFGVWATERFAVKPDGYTIKFEHPDAGQSSTITYKVCIPFIEQTIPTVVLWKEAAGDFVEVTGVVMDNAATPVPVEGATVTFVLQDTSAYTVIVTTNAAGEYAVPTIPAGVYDITASKTGYVDEIILDEDLSLPTNTLDITLDIVVGP